MKHSGNLLKMSSELNKPVDYYMNFDKDGIYLNELLNKTISIKYSGIINCIKCGRKTNKSFSQGFCFPCFQTAPEADPAIVKPELDQAHLGISRDMEWAKTHSLVDHYVYLAISSGLKVGVTRHTQIPTRWIDQGAESAIKIARTPNRNTAGRIEVELKQHFADKTNWRNMLTNKVVGGVDLLSEKRRALSLLTQEFLQYKSDEDEVFEITYPVLDYPIKVNSLSLDKMPEFEGRLTGIKGQYLIFGNGIVFNVRAHSGYLVEIEY